MKRLCKFSIRAWINNCVYFWIYIRPKKNVLLLLLHWSRNLHGNYSMHNNTVSRIQYKAPLWFLAKWKLQTSSKTTRCCYSKTWFLSSTLLDALFSTHELRYKFSVCANFYLRYTQLPCLGLISKKSQIVHLIVDVCLIPKMSKVNDLITSLLGDNPIRHRLSTSRFYNQSS
jgi:hypothetical protein